MKKSTSTQKGGSTTTAMMDHIRENFVPFLQLMSVDLKGRFNTGLIRTKCLNTAVMVMYLAAGEKGLQEAFTCNVNKVLPRYANVFNKKTLNTSHLQTLVNQISPQKDSLADKYYTHMVDELTQATPDGRLHYIMLTDSEMNSVDPTKPSMKVFPGHVFCIEQRGKEYHLYQSYINAYDMTSQVTEHNKGTTKRSLAWIRKFSLGLHHFIHADVWDKQCADFWTFLTHTDATKFVGHDKSAIYLCHSSLSSKDSFNHFDTYVGEKIEQISGIINANPVAAGDVYGDKNLYYQGMVAREDHRSFPYTTGHLLQVLKSIKV